MQKEDIELTMNFRTNIKWIGGRKGEIFIKDYPSILFDVPKEFKGEGTATSPEELFLGAFGACILTTFTHFAKKMRLNFENLDIDVEGDLEKEKKGPFKFTAIHGVFEITVPNEKEEEKAERCFELTNKYCIVSNSISESISLDFDFKSNISKE